MRVENSSDMRYVRKNFIQVKNKLLNKYSPAESHFVELLNKSGIYYEREKTNFRYNSRWSYFDFYLPYYNLYVEIDGSSHDNASQQAIDAEKEDIIKRKQRYLVRLTNEEVLALEELSIDYLLDKQFEQRAAKRKRGTKRKARNQYYRVMGNKREEAIRNMKRDAPVEVDEDQEVWLYDNTSGNYFRFTNLFEARFTLEMSIRELHNLLENTEYKHSTVRRFVMAYTRQECELRVMATYF